MKTLKWQEEKDQREKESLQRHARLARLFKSDRLAFERERKEMIDALINSVKNEDQRKRLQAFQDSWDKKMRGAGSRHNRFVLAQTFFWEHFHDIWHPAIRKYSFMLNGGSDDRNS